jgi:hypothetical protein
MARTFYSIWQDAFPDNEVRVTDIFEDGATAILQAEFRGTQTETMNAPEQTIPATGRRVNIPFVVINRFDGGKITQFTLYFDRAELPGQLSLLQPRASQRGEVGGSGSTAKVSRIARSSCPLRRASTTASSSNTAPRPTLTTTAPHHGRHLQPRRSGAAARGGRSARTGAPLVTVAVPQAALLYPLLYSRERRATLVG